MAILIAEVVLLICTAVYQVTYFSYGSTWNIIPLILLSKCVLPPLVYRYLPSEFKSNSVVT